MPPDPEAALQSGAIARSADGSVVWSAHPDEGAVSRTELSTGDSASLPLAGEPTHVAHIPLVQMRRLATFSRGGVQNTDSGTPR